jgi:hypothetical protein
MPDQKGLSISRLKRAIKDNLLDSLPEDEQGDAEVLVIPDTRERMIEVTGDFCPIELGEEVSEVITAMMTTMARCKITGIRVSMALAFEQSVI